MAFTVTAMVMGVIYQIYAKGTTASLLGEEYTQAVAIAESKLAMLGRSETMDASEYQGLEHDKYHWVLIIEDYDDEGSSKFTSSQHLKSVHIEVSWESGGKHRSIHLDSLRPVIES